ncbi:hypothetical protein [Sagittula sp. S175]|uniref:hypothetical protein n=1 Tax=Sagittula sp. S175 TaxID=3415129 RepID=UPI003C7E4DFA
MRRLWREAPYLTAGLLLALVVAGFFGVRLVLGAVFWADPRHQDMPIAPWMTPRFVAMSWDVPKEVVIEALGMKQDGHGPEPLKKMAEERGVPVEALVAELEAAIAAYRADTPLGAGHE